jgi:uncharacterized 2Fe-2S/4Fe-4S cluster protein (DUF4445 family)
VILASDTASQESELVLGLDLGTNGEIFLGNQRQLLTCSAAAGPAFEGANISEGMIAKVGAIEGVRSEEGQICYRIIGNTKPRGICGSGLTDLVAVLLHCGIISSEGQILPPRADVEKDLQSRVVERDGVFDFLVAAEGESLTQRPLFLKQKDIRELQLAKGAVAAGVQMLMKKMGVDIKDIDRIYLSGALGNYINPYSAMRIGLIPTVDLAKIKSLGNAASTGATLALLSKTHWQKASEITQIMKHIELSSCQDFNDCFVENLDFPQENLW